MTGRAMWRAIVASVAALPLSGCFHPSITSPERLALEAAVVGWTEALGEPDARECGLDLVTVVHVTAARFRRACKIEPGPGGAGACLLYESVGFSRSAPIIVLRPGLDDDDVREAVIHESLHNFIECELDRSPRDPFDALHTDPRVWQGAGGATSAQARARAAVE